MLAVLYTCCTWQFERVVRMPALSVLSDSCTSLPLYGYGELKMIDVVALSQGKWAKPCGNARNA